MGRREEMAQKVRELMPKTEKIRNIGIVAHIDHGKTTLSDNLIWGAGLMSEELAGKELALDSYELEAERGITIFSANISMVYNFDGDDYLINLIDTPGHVDFGGEVTRAMRAVDGVIVVVCAVEGVMPQTETVLRQALKEKVKPVLFINKVDRLINELQLSPEQIQQKLAKIIGKVNALIERYAPPEFKKEWQVSVEKGSVAFGSAYQKWGISLPFMKKAGINFAQMYEMVKNGQIRELYRKAPLYQVVLDMVIKHLPSPLVAQKYRIPTIWKGDINSDVGKAMTECDKNGPVAIMLTKIIIDPHAGEIALGRIYSGTVKKGMKLTNLNTKREGAVQQLSFYMNTGRFQIDAAPAGNVIAISGIKDVAAGETLANIEMIPFEGIKHYSEPVITKSVEAKNPKDLPKLIEVLRQIAKEDPTVKVEINQETGEHLISGMGELHLEIIEHRIRHDKGVDIITSDPIVVYRESVSGVSDVVEGKSPNRHNKFYIKVEPLEDGVYNALVSGEVVEGKPKSAKELASKLEKFGMNYDEAKRIWMIHNHCVFIDDTKGVQYLNEAKELILQGFIEAVEGGPLAKEKMTKVKVKLVDAVLHEDAVHRGPAQVIPAVRRAIHAAFLKANPCLLEPKQKLFISVPQEYMGQVMTEIQARRGQVLEVNQEEDVVNIVAKVPVAEMFGFASQIRALTQGRALWSTEYWGYEKLPKELEMAVIKKVRERKGLPDHVPTPEELLS